MQRQREQKNTESERILRMERDEVSSLESELAKLKHEKVELERRLHVESNRVRAIADDMKTLKAEQAELATLKRQSEQPPQWEASGTRPMLITECQPENTSVDPDVNDGTTRLRPLTARCAGRNVMHFSGYQHSKPRYGSRRKSHDVCVGNMAIGQGNAGLRAKADMLLILTITWGMTRRVMMMKACSVRF